MRLRLSPFTMNNQDITQALRLGLKDKTKQHFSARFDWLT